ncbi:MAG TPA: hypothetical protein HA257_09070, partial [Candidatus Methanoperedenaceae archaeon]|nr:hypothetical protein [Candidatus Methanoperedenaceae archaeon]
MDIGIWIQAAETLITGAGFQLFIESRYLRAFDTIWGPIFLGTILILVAVLSMRSVLDAPQSALCFAIISLLTTYLIQERILIIGYPDYPREVAVAVLFSLTGFFIFTIGNKRYFPYSSIFSSLIMSLIYIMALRHEIGIFSWDLFMFYLFVNILS